MHVTISTIFSFISVIDSETGEWNGAPNFNVCGKKLTATAFFPVFRVYGIAPSSMCVVGQYMLHMGVALVSALTYHSQTLHISSDPQHIYSCGETCSVVNILEFRACHHVINCSPPPLLSSTSMRVAGEIGPAGANVGSKHALPPHDAPPTGGQLQLAPTRARGTAPPRQLRGSYSDTGCSTGCSLQRLPCEGLSVCTALDLRDYPFRAGFRLSRQCWW